MNLLAARVVLRERTLADVLDLALPLCWANRRPLGVLAAATSLPIAVLAAVLRTRAHGSWPKLWLLLAVAWLATEGIYTVAFGDLLFQEARAVSPAAVARRFLRRLPVLLTVVGVRQVVLWLAASLFVPVFMWGPSTLFVQESLLLEGATLRKTWTRSRALARNRRGFCTGLWLATIAMPALGAIVGDQAGTAVLTYVLQLGQPAGSLFVDGGSAFAVLGFLLGVPVASAARFLGYINLRTRKEGWDIQLRFMALAAAASSSVSAPAHAAAAAGARG